VFCHQPEPAGCLAGGLWKEFGEMSYFLVMLDADVEGVPLHVVRAGLVGCLQDLDDVVHAEVSLEVLPKEYLLSIVGDLCRGHSENVRGSFEPVVIRARGCPMCFVIGQGLQDVKQEVFGERL